MDTCGCTRKLTTLMRPGLSSSSGVIACSHCFNSRCDCGRSLIARFSSPVICCGGIGHARHEHVELHLDALLRVAQAENHRALGQNESSAEHDAGRGEQTRQLIADAEAMQERLEIEQPQITSMEEVQALRPAAPPARDRREDRDQIRAGTPPPRAPRAADLAAGRRARLA